MSMKLIAAQYLPPAFPWIFDISRSEGLCILWQPLAGLGSRRSWHGTPVDADRLNSDRASSALAQLDSGTQAAPSIGAWPDSSFTSDCLSKPYSLKSGNPQISIEGGCLGLDLDRLTGLGEIPFRVWARSTRQVSGSPGTLSTPERDLVRCVASRRGSDASGVRSLIYPHGRPAESDASQPAAYPVSAPMTCPRPWYPLNATSDSGHASSRPEPALLGWPGKVHSTLGDVAKGEATAYSLSLTPEWQRIQALLSRELSGGANA